jgi:signal transduction histidine kinase
VKRTPSRTSLTGRLALEIALVLFLCAALAAGTNYLLARRAIQQAQPAMASLESSTAGSDALVDILERSGSASADEAIRGVAVGALVAVAVTTAVGLAASRALARRALRPLRLVAGFVDERSHTNLESRIELDAHDAELDHLVDNLNGMLDRLHRAFENQRLFAAHASHELRTPLAIIETSADVTLADQRAGLEQHRDALRTIDRAVQRTQLLLDRLTMLARLDGTLTHTEAVPLHAIVRSVIDDLAGQHPTIVVGADCEPSTVPGDPRLLETALRNLIDNACRHNHAGGEVTVEVGHRSDAAHLTVRNTGPTVTEDQAARLTEPFQRGDAGVPGTGLGLTIAARILDLHRGTLTLTPNTGGGLTVQVVLPGYSTSG